MTVSSDIVCHRCAETHEKSVVMFESEEQKEPREGDYFKCGACGYSGVVDEDCLGSRQATLDELTRFLRLIEAELRKRGVSVSEMIPEASEHLLN